MPAQPLSNPDLQKWSDHIRVLPAIKERGRHKSNLWIFDSPKNNHRFIIKGDVAFMHFVLLEGNVAVQSYIPEPPPVYASIDGEVRQTMLDAEVHMANGVIEWWEFKRSIDTEPSRKKRSKPQLSAQAQAASAAKKKNHKQTKKKKQNKKKKNDNKQMLCAA